MSAYRVGEPAALRFAGFDWGAAGHGESRPPRAGRRERGTMWSGGGRGGRGEGKDEERARMEE